MSTLKYYDKVSAAWKRVKDSIGVKSFNTRTGPVTLNQTDVTDALGFTPPTDSQMIQAQADIASIKAKDTNQDSEIDDINEKEAVQDVTLAQHAETLSSHEAEIEKLDNKKVGYSELSGSQLLMYSDSTKATLLATLDLPASPVHDVQINGSTIVSDGIAVIPKATAMAPSQLSQYGITRYNPELGVTASPQNNYEWAMAAKAMHTHIDARRVNDSFTTDNMDANSCRQIVPSNLDYAIKAALTDSKRDTTYSDAEKDNACGVIGAVRSRRLELIETITTSAEAAEDISREAEPDGTAYCFDAVYLKITNSSTAQTAWKYWMIYAKTPEGKEYCVDVPYSMNSKIIQSICYHDFMWHHYLINNNSENYSSSAPYQKHMLMNTSDDYISHIVLPGVVANSTIEIYGIRRNV